MARLIAAHPSYQLVPSELRFHAEPSGLFGLLTGDLDSRWVTNQLRTHWAQRRSATGQPRGLTTFMAPEECSRAIDAFESKVDDDPVTASRDLLSAVVASALPQGEPANWVETTPPNLEAAGALARMFPEARFVHVTRSGLDVACSMQKRAWAPDALGDCLLWWEDRFERADAGARSLPPENLHEVQLERLTDPESREQVGRALLDFLELDDAPEVRDFRRSVLHDRPAKAPPWQELPSEEQTELLAFYHQALRRLQRAGVRNLPVDADRALAMPTPSAGIRAHSKWRRLTWRARRGRRWNWRPSRRQRLVARLGRSRRLVGALTLSCPFPLP